MKNFILTLVLLLAALSISHEVIADEVYTFVVKKQEKKQISRWSLQEWLSTQERIKMMDMWLAMHSPSPYEFFLYGDYQNTTVGSTDGTTIAYGAGAYASIAGLELHREGARTTGLLGLRIFGFQLQGTHLLLTGGLRQENGARGGVLGVSSAIYLSKYFGIDGAYRWLLESAQSGQSGHRIEAGGFIDFNFLRVYGGWFKESLEATAFSQTKTAVHGGLKIFF